MNRFSPISLLTSFPHTIRLSRMITVGTLFLTTSCSATSSGTSVPLGSKSNDRAKIAPWQAAKPPRPSESYFKILERGTIASTVLKTHFAAIDALKSNARSPLSTVTSFDEGGQLGITVASDGGNGSNSFGVVQGYYPPSEVNVPAAPVDKKNYLYAPTTHWPGQCFEVGSEYAADSTGTVIMKLYVLDFCTRPNATFTYFEMNQQYLIPVDAPYRDDNSPAPDIAWSVGSGMRSAPDTTNNYVAISVYEPSTGYTYYPVLPGVEEPADAVPLRSDGWSIFETHYNAGGVCGSVPAFYSLSMSGYNTSTFSENDYDYANAGQTGIGNQCTMDDRSGKGYFYAITTSTQPTRYGNGPPRQQWNISSTPSSSSDTSIPTATPTANPSPS